MPDRSKSPLAEELRQRIRAHGPLPVAEWMALCLGHPQHGYYATRDPFGTAGDFTTAPEISQMFGELLGLWAATVWQHMGAPTRVHLVELGPGRGTMMADVLRAARVLPAFRAAVTVHLVETSPVLQQRQRESLAAAAAPIAWHRDLADVPAGPTIVLANEFFDAVPVHQAVKSAAGWHARTVALAPDNCFVFDVGPADPAVAARVPEFWRSAPAGAIFEWRNDDVAQAIATRAACQGAALVVDYGHVGQDLGETLQAVRAHRFVDPLEAPGEADLTAHVDFVALARTAAAVGARVDGPVTQGEFLRRLGIVARADALKAAAPEKAAEIDAALARLLDPGKTGMGALFKVLGFAHPSLAPLPGLD